MLKGFQLFALAVFFIPVARATIPCPVTVVDGAEEGNAFSVTFQNAGKLIIRRLEFNCKMLLQGGKVQSLTRCGEENALFFPGMEYTVRYPYPGGTSRPVSVSLKAVTLSNGYIWKPTPHQLCRAVKIYPRKARK
jgi:hypothetical protein